MDMKNQSKSQSSNQRNEVYSSITNQIIASIENGVGEVQLPWHRKGFSIARPSNVQSKNSYNGVNIISLWIAAYINGFEHGIWGTYKQWQDRGAQVRKGEQSSLIVFFKDIDVENENGEENSRYSIARASHVFNVAQVDGFEIDVGEPQIDKIIACENAEHFVQATNAKIEIGGMHAFYRPSTDSITMPDRHRFIGTDNASPSEGWYSTLLHELTHWSGASHRLDREFGERFGDNKYAMEELVAELGSAFLCSELGISPQPREDHACYINNWLQVLKQDSRAIITAASKASKASEYLKALIANNHHITEAAEYLLC